MVSLHFIPPKKSPLAMKELEMNLALLRERRGGVFSFVLIQTVLSFFSFFFSFRNSGKLARLVLIYHTNNEDKGLQSHFQLSNSITLFFFLIQGESPFFALDWANLVYSDADEGPGAATALSFSNQPPTFCPEQISFAPRMDFSRPAQWIFPGC